MITSPRQPSRLSLRLLKDNMGTLSALPWPSSALPPSMPAISNTPAVLTAIQNLPQSSMEFSHATIVLSLALGLLLPSHLHHFHYSYLTSIIYRP